MALTDDIDYISEHMRDIDITEIKTLYNLEPDVGLKESCRVSNIVEIYHHNDKPVAVFGLVIYEQNIIPWMIATNDINLISPRTIIVKAREFLSPYSFSDMSNFVLRDNVKSVRLLSGLGFNFTETFVNEVPVYYCYKKGTPSCV